MIAQKTAVLPVEPPTPDFDVLHDALVRYDQLISLYVIQAIQALPFHFPADQARALRDELKELFDQAPNNRETENYRRYFQRLTQMNDLVEQAPAQTAGDSPA